MVLCKVGVGGSWQPSLPARQGQSPALRTIPKSHPTSGLPFTTGTRVSLTEVQVAYRGLVTPSTINQIFKS